MSNQKYSVDTVGDDIADFLDAVLDAGDFDVEYEILDGEEAGDYFEKPTLVVKFSGPDLEFLMNNKGEALLALEQLTQEVLDMAPDEHALLCFDANDYRLLRQEELRCRQFGPDRRQKGAAIGAFRQYQTVHPGLQLG